MGGWQLLAHMIPTLLLLLCGSSVVLSIFTPTCISENSQHPGITWWFIRKFPGSYDYLYMDSTNEDIIFVKDGLTSTTGALYLTMSQLPSGTTYATKDEASWIFYNDQPGSAYERLRDKFVNGGGGKSAHAKGVLAFGQDPGAPNTCSGGFHLTHSLPEFPVGLKSSGIKWIPPTPLATDDKAGWLANSKTYGQSLFCYTITKDEVDNALAQLIKMDAYFYHQNIDQANFANYPSLLQDFLSTGKSRPSLGARRKASTCATDNTADVCMQGALFSNANIIWFSKPGFGAGKDDQGDVVSMAAFRLNKIYLQTTTTGTAFNVISQTQLEGFPSNKNCGSQCAVTPKVYDAVSYRWPYLPIKSGVEKLADFMSPGDHSKFFYVEIPTLPTPGGNEQNWVCIGDLNRVISNIARGGGAVCVNNYKLALALNRMTLTTDQCIRGATYSTEATPIHQEFRVAGIVPSFTSVEILENNFPLNPRLVVQSDIHGNFEQWIRVQKDPIVASIKILLSNNKDLVLCSANNVANDCENENADGFIRIKIPAPANIKIDAFVKLNIDPATLTVPMANRYFAYTTLAKVYNTYPDAAAFPLAPYLRIVFVQTQQYDIAPNRDYIAVPDFAAIPVCIDSLYAQFARLYLRRTNPNFIGALSNHNMQAQLAQSQDVIYNSAVNAALMLIRYNVLPFQIPAPAPDTKLSACYAGNDVEMELFVSASRNGGTSEGWFTAFLWDLIDLNDETNNDVDGNKGLPKHGDMLAGVTLERLRGMTNKITVGWPLPFKFYTDVIFPDLLEFNQKQKDFTAEYNYVQACACQADMDVCTGSKKRDPPTDPLLQALTNAGICGDVLSTMTTEDLNDLKLYLARWMTDGSNSYSQNQGIDKLLTDPNIRGNSAGTAVVESMESDFDILSYEQGTVTVKDNLQLSILDPSQACQCEDKGFVLNPLKVVPLTSALYNLALIAQTAITFDNYTFYYYQKNSWDSRPYEGVTIVKYNDKLCNFFLQNQADFASNVPDENTCLFGPPVLQSIQPQSGVAQGGTLVTIQGYHFDASSVASIGNVECSETSFVSATQIVCKAPAGSGINRLVSVANSASNYTSTSNSSAILFSYDAPIVTSISPLEGSTSQVTTVTITGKNFGTAAASIDFVSIGPLACTNFNAALTTESQIVCDVPPGTGASLDIVVSVNGQASNLTETSPVFFFPPPTVTSVQAASGPCEGGLRVIITGTNFGTEQNTTLGLGRFFLVDVYYFTDVTVMSDTQISALSPPGAGFANDVVVYVDGQVGVGTGLFSFAAPTITPGNPPYMLDTVGGLLDVYGTFFGPFFVGSAVDNVLLGSTEIDYYNDNATCEYIPLYIPFGIGANLPLSIIVGGQTSNQVEFSYIPPTVTYMNGSIFNTSGGGVLSINGTNFVPLELNTADYNITDGGVSYSNITTQFGSHKALCQVLNWTSSLVECTIPAGIGANVSLVVYVGGQASNSFFFSYAAPLVASITPTNGTTDGNTKVTIHGSNFVPEGYDPSGTNSTIYIDGKACNQVEWVDSSTCICDSPSGSGRDLVVQVVVAGQESPAKRLFSYLAPKVTSITSPSFPTQGGVTVTIDGSDFGVGDPKPTVSFAESGKSSVECSNVAFVSSSQLTCVLPEGYGESWSVLVTVDDQESNQDVDFSYDAPKITLLAPADGPQEGGNPVLIEGENFYKDISLISVVFGTASADCSFTIPHTALTCTAPPKVGSMEVEVSVKVDGRASSNTETYTYNDRTTSTSTTTTTTTDTTDSTTTDSTTSATDSTTATTGSTTATTGSSATTGGNNNGNGGSTGGPGGFLSGILAALAGVASTAAGAVGSSGSSVASAISSAAANAVSTGLSVADTTAIASLTSAVSAAAAAGGSASAVAAIATTAADSATTSLAAGLTTSSTSSGPGTTGASTTLLPAASSSTTSSSTTADTTTASTTATSATTDTSVTTATTATTEVAATTLLPATGNSSTSSTGTTSISSTSSTTDASTTEIASTTLLPATGNSSTSSSATTTASTTATTTATTTTTEVAATTLLPANGNSSGSSTGTSTTASTATTEIASTTLLPATGNSSTSSTVTATASTTSSTTTATTEATSTTLLPATSSTSTAATTSTGTSASTTDASSTTEASTSTATTETASTTLLPATGNSTSSTATTSTGASTSTTDASSTTATTEIASTTLLPATGNSSTSSTVATSTGTSTSTTDASSTTATTEIASTTLLPATGNSSTSSTSTTDASTSTATTEIASTTSNSSTSSPVSTSTGSSTSTTEASTTAATTEIATTIGNSSTSTNSTTTDASTTEIASTSGSTATSGSTTTATSSGSTTTVTSGSETSSTSGSTTSGTTATPGSTTDSDTTAATSSPTTVDSGTTTATSDSATTATTGNSSNTTANSNSVTTTATSGTATSGSTITSTSSSDTTTATPGSTTTATSGATTVSSGSTTTVTSATITTSSNTTATSDAATTATSDAATTATSDAATTATSDAATTATSGAATTATSDAATTTTSTSSLDTTTTTSGSGSTTATSGSDTTSATSGSTTTATTTTFGSDTSGSTTTATTSTTVSASLTSGSSTSSGTTATTGTTTSLTSSSGTTGTVSNSSTSSDSLTSGSSTTIGSSTSSATNGSSTGTLTTGSTLSTTGTTTGGPACQGACLDYVVAIDTSSNMSTYLDAVKQQNVQLVDQLFATQADTRVAVVTYRDFASRTDDPVDYPYKANLAWSSDPEAIKSTINSLTLGDGGDKNNTVYSAAIDAMMGNGIGTWRKGAVKSMLLIGDAPPLDPEPFTGYTLDTVHQFASSIGTSRSDTTSVYISTIPLGTDQSVQQAFRAIASITGATSIPAPSAQDLASAISKSISNTLALVLPAVGECINSIAVTQTLVNQWESNGITSSQWTTTISAGSQALYNLSMLLSPAPTSSWNIEKVGDIFTLPSYQYVRNAIQPHTSVSFGYIINSASPSAITFLGNPCEVPARNCSVTLAQTAQSSYSSSDFFYQPYVIAITNYGSAPADYVNITIALQDSSYAISQSYNLDPVSANGNTQIVTANLNSLAPLASISYFGYTVSVPVANARSFVAPLVLPSGVVCAP